MLIYSILILLFFSFVRAITLEEYRQLQNTNPQNMLEEIDIQQHSTWNNMQKLIFLTPWNSEGFTYTLKYAKKINVVSPCWYQIILDNKGLPKFQNEHNYQQQYSTNIKIANPQIKLLPRIYISGQNYKVFQSIGNSKANFQHTIRIISNLIKQKQFDGFVWDSPYNFYQKSRSQLNSLINQLITAIKQSIGNKLIYFNMANPISHMNLLEQHLYKESKIDTLLIQNYDSSSDYIALIDRAISWKNKINPNIKMILMLPFFTIQSYKGSISTSDAVNSLIKNGVASSQTQQRSLCRFMQKRTKKQYLIPCFNYFQKALKKAQLAQAGIGFWQGGNGIELYYKFL